MHYVDISLCRETIFPFIHEYLSEHESAPAYGEEERGMGELEKVLTFVRDDEFYPTFAEKAAYLICGLAGSQYFSNGNKRSGVAVLLLFLALNNAKVEMLDPESYRKLLLDFYPHALWEENPDITDAHALFLYNLVLVIGDRNQRGDDGFDRLKENVGKLCAHLYRIP